MPLEKKPKYWHHGTSSDRLDSILQHGLLPGSACKQLKVGDKVYDYCPDGIYFEENPRSAVEWGVSAALRKMRPRSGAAYNPPENIAVFRISDGDVKRNCTVTRDPAIRNRQAIIATDCSLYPQEIALVSWDAIRRSKLYRDDIKFKWKPIKVRSHQRRA